MRMARRDEGDHSRVSVHRERVLICGAWEAHTPCGASTEEQQSQASFSTKTPGRRLLLPLSGAGSAIKARKTEHHQSCPTQQGGEDAQPRPERPMGSGDPRVLNKAKTPRRIASHSFKPRS